MKKKKKSYEYEEVMVAHMLCCPYYNIHMGETHKDLGNIITCGSNHKQCDGKCYYMNHFEEVLNRTEEEADE